ncbi:phosphotransferase family protein [Nocardia altamirensis]|uniref:phosphotransferase family protein n=1 Tax=Nocardia altamirensis TaxID=472158 RepID=UPI00084065F3|nr:aminoglycoside phosphotransferase family protein [Nocardia altamirensis]
MESAAARGLIEAHRELLGRLLPGATSAELTVHEGQFHFVVLGSARVVRLARTEAAAARLPACAGVLRALADIALGVAVPEPLAVAGPDEQVPYLVLTRIPGAPLDYAVTQQRTIAEAVARQCHALLVRLSVAGRNDALRELLPSTTACRWREFADGVRAELYPLMDTAGRERAERELSALDSLPHLTRTIVHGDLGGANLLWDNITGRPELRGVVDWDDAALGDPAEDYAALGAGYGTPVLRALLELAHPADGDLAARIAVIQGTFALQQALAAHRDGDAAELADGLTGYRLS